MEPLPSVRARSHGNVQRLRRFALLCSVFLAYTGFGHDATYYSHYTNSGMQLSLVLTPSQAVYWGGTTLEMQIRAFGYIQGWNGPGPSSSLPVNCYIDGQRVSMANAPWAPYNANPVSSYVPVLGLSAGAHTVTVENTNSWEYITETRYSYTSTHGFFYTYYHTYYNVYHHLTVPCSASQTFTVTPSTNFHRLRLSAHGAAKDTVLLEDTFDGASGAAPNPTNFNSAGEVALDGNSHAALQTWSYNQSSLSSVANAAMPAELTLRFRASTYCEGSTIYGDGQPRGLRFGSDANNAIEFYSASGTTIGIRTRSNGAESSAFAPLPSGVDSLHDYEIRVHAGSAVFMVDGTTVGTLTNNLPGGALNFHICTHDGYAGNVPATLDSVKMTVSTPASPALEITYTAIPTNTYWLYWSSDLDTWNLHSSAKSSTNGLAVWSGNIYPGQMFYRAFGP